jgi:hypothetical protein
MWSLFSDAVNLEAPPKILYVADILAFHWFSGFPDYTIKTKTLLENTPIIFTVYYSVPPLLAAPPIDNFKTTSGYNILFAKAHYSTVVSFDLDLDMCPGNTVPKDDDGDCDGSSFMKEKPPKALNPVPGFSDPSPIEQMKQLIKPENQFFDNKGGNKIGGSANP